MFYHITEQLSAANDYELLVSVICVIGWFVSYSMDLNNDMIYFNYSTSLTRYDISAKHNNHSPCPPNLSHWQVCYAVLGGSSDQFVICYDMDPSTIIDNSYPLPPTRVIGRCAIQRWIVCLVFRWILLIISYQYSSATRLRNGNVLLHQPCQTTFVPWLWVIGRCVMLH